MGGVCFGGVSAPGVVVSASGGGGGGVCSGGVSAPGGGGIPACTEADPLPPCEQNE